MTTEQFCGLRLAAPGKVDFHTSQSVTQFLKEAAAQREAGDRGVLWVDEDTEYTATLKPEIARTSIRYALEHVVVEIERACSTANSTAERLSIAADLERLLEVARATLDLMKMTKPGGEEEPAE